MYPNRTAAPAFTLPGLTAWYKGDRDESGGFPFGYLRYGAGPIRLMPVI